MAHFTNNQKTGEFPIILPPSARHEAFDFDEDKVPISQQLGDISDKIFSFTFNPNTIKFGVLLFAAFCVAIDLSGYYDLMNQVFSTRLDELGRTLPVDAPLGDRFISSAVRFPILGTMLVWLDKLTGGLMALFGAIAIWFVVQGLEIAARFHIYLPGTAQNLLYKQNRQKIEAPANNAPATRKAYKLASGETMSILRWLALVGILAYFVNAYAMDISRPWLDNLGNPLWTNIIWNSHNNVAVMFLAFLVEGISVPVFLCCSRLFRQLTPPQPPIKRLEEYQNESLEIHLTSPSCPSG